MENLTLGQISVGVSFVVVLIGSLIALGQYIKKVLNKTFENDFKTVNDKLDDLDSSIKTTDLNATKNFLIARLEEIKKGEKLDDITFERFWEQYGHYHDLGGNSYLEKEVERLRKEGKL